ncbi:MAG TPA: XRE family transcriptional regulator [Pseudolabrys sp.]|jgi:Zn-dependent peptidase ImmA (M78 family)|nr:XRE family transcriptional regulator [Pseudolabrys sp.]
MFNIHRLELARARRRYTAKILAERAKIAPVTLSRIVNGQQIPDEETIDKLVSALGFPRAFFFKDDIDRIDVSSASFRSLKAMTARERDAALSAGSFAYELTDWVKARFNLPAADLLDLSYERNPESAARLLRQHWAIGEKPIGNVVKLLETKGVRVFSLAENTRNVDAFSCWRDDEPYIFLNTFTTPERSRFDAAHELGHLILHKHGGPRQGRSTESEAHAFAGHFLMPRDDMLAMIPFVTGVAQLLKAKKRWGVSVSALAYHLHRLGLISDWHHRTLCIQINKQFGRSEPDSLSPERSGVWQMVLRELWKDRMARNHIADDLAIPEDELENLIFGLTGETGPPENFEKPHLKSV